MEVRNCRRCGKMFVYVGRDLCPECREEDERDFDRVREYLRRNPQADIDELHGKTQVDKDKILGFLREGRLEVDKDGLSSNRKCRLCGKTISEGRICQDCLRKFKSSMPKGKELELENKRPGSRMYITDIWDKKRRK